MHDNIKISLKDTRLEIQLKYLASFIDVDQTVGTLFIDAVSEEQAKEIFLAHEHACKRNYHGLVIKAVEQIPVVNNRNFQLEQKPLYLIDVYNTADSISKEIGAEYAGIVKYEEGGVAEPHNFDISAGWTALVLNQLKSEGLEQLIGQRVYENARKLQSDEESDV